MHLTGCISAVFCPHRYLGDNPTDEQISNVHNMLEALRWICPRWLAELSSGGTDQNEGSQYSHVLDEDKKALALLLRKYIGANWATLRAPQRLQKLQMQAATVCACKAARTCMCMHVHMQMHMQMQMHMHMHMHTCTCTCHMHMPPLSSTCE